MTDRDMEETKLINVILKIPEETARFTMTADLIGDDGKVYHMEAVLSPSDIRQARQDFLDNVEAGDDFDAVYVLTELGRKYLEQTEDEKTCEYTED